MIEVKKLRLLAIEADKYNGDIIKPGVYKKLTFVFEEETPKQLITKDGKPAVNSEGEPVFERFWYPCYKDESYIVPAVYEELNAILELLDSGVKPMVKVPISDVEYEGKFYKRIEKKHLRQMELMV